MVIDWVATCSTPDSLGWDGSGKKLACSELSTQGKRWLVLTIVVKLRRAEMHLQMVNVG